MPGWPDRRAHADRGLARRPARDDRPGCGPRPARPGAGGKRRAAPARRCPLRDVPLRRDRQRHPAHPHGPAEPRAGAGLHRRLRPPRRRRRARTGRRGGTRLRRPARDHRGDGSDGLAPSAGNRRLPRRPGRGLCDHPHLVSRAPRRAGRQGRALRRGRRRDLRRLWPLSHRHAPLVARRQGDARARQFRPGERAAPPARRLARRHARRRGAGHPPRPHPPDGRTGGRHGGLAAERPADQDRPRPDGPCRGRPHPVPRSRRGAGRLPAARCAEGGLQAAARRHRHVGAYQPPHDP